MIGSRAFSAPLFKGRFSPSVYFLEKYKIFAGALYLGAAKWYYNL